MNIDVVKNKSVISTYGHRNDLESIGFVIPKCLVCGKMSNIKCIVLKTTHFLKLNSLNCRVKEFSKCDVPYNKWSNEFERSI